MVEAIVDRTEHDLVEGTFAIDVRIGGVDEVVRYTGAPEDIPRWNLSGHGEGRAYVVEVGDLEAWKTTGAEVVGVVNRAVPTSESGPDSLSASVTWNDVKHFD